MGTGLFGRLQQELEARERAAGLSMADVLELPDSLRKLVNWMTRQNEVSLAEVVAYVGADETTTRSMLATLIEKGFIREMEVHGETRYKVRLAPRRKHEIPLDIWRALDEKVEGAEEGA